MPQVVWLPEALDDLNRVYDFLALKNPDAAARAAQAIFEAANSLSRIHCVALSLEQIQIVES
nr:type II toxin-antitoxin system RelE/ParE family toxin [Leptolyngbya sp. NK1-12]